jgi:mannose/cellobiose epimerase-like protein (N-acyl-D-glucosamine 2-epimerase family)
MHRDITTWREVRSHRLWLAEQTMGLLAFARGSKVDRGFGWLDDDGVPDPARPPQLWITSRMTHIFAVGNLLGIPGCGPLVDHGLLTIRDTFEDSEHGGWFSDDPASGGDGRKEAYGSSFVLLAASSGAMAGREPAMALLHEAATVITRRFWSEKEGACLESWDREWAEPEPYRGANANMHMVEAFLAAGDATGDAVWFTRALRIAEQLIHDVARAHEWRVIEHFDGEWRPLPDYNADQPSHPFRPFGVTPGHGLEWSRLMLQLRSGLESPPGWLLEAAEGLFARATADGWQANGGFVYTTDQHGEPVVRQRLWWVVTEGIGAAAALHAETGERRYEEWYRTLWDFAATHLIDAARGSWHSELDGRLQPTRQTWVGKPDVYHSLQASVLPRFPVRPSVARAVLSSQG